jgi:hypothetical protein
VVGEERLVDVQRQLEAEAGLGVVEVVAGQLADAVEAVEDGVAVDVEALGRLLGGAAGGEEGAQGADQLGVVVAVVGEEGTEGFLVEGGDLG